MPAIIQKAYKIFLPFLTTYLCKARFSLYLSFKTTYDDRLNEGPAVSRERGAPLVSLKACREASLWSQKCYRKTQRVYYCYFK